MPSAQYYKFTEEVEYRKKVEQILSEVETISQFVDPPKPSKFIKTGESTWVYPEALKATKEIKGYTINAYEKKLIALLTVPMAYFLYRLLEPKFGFKPRLGTTKENFSAAFGGETKEYAKRVLRTRVLTSELIAIDDIEADFRRILDIEMVNKKDTSFPDQVILDCTGSELPLRSFNAVRLRAKPKGRRATQVVYKVGGTLGRDDVLRREGYFDSFDEIPTSLNLKPMSEISKGHCSEISDSTSVVRITCEKDDLFNKICRKSAECLQIHMYCPTLAKDNLTIQSIWTDEDPKK